ncbi:unnamed protein product [Cuscuta epithymum]|uniref:Uncharacterized protein n=1 Tax=Cuscuta epithymum TaxID=186058 RepID=A0AAV0DIN4_9ASTE|nr:unnamed protein product [Cuscuta epithymum]
MKLVWSPERASKAYLDTVKSGELFQESSVAELVSAMAAGWDAQLIVETWSKGGVTATSVGLGVASHYAGGRHVCVVPDHESREEYAEAMHSAGVRPEIIVGQPEEAMERLAGIDFLVVDCRRTEFSRILRVAKLGHRGAVLICKNASSRVVSDFRWRSVLDGKTRIVRSVLLPVGKGLDIAHVGATVGGGRKWIKHFDEESGEEFLFRK